MRRYLRATLGALALLTTAAAGSLAIGAVAPSLAGATVAMGTTSGGEVTPVAGTPHTHPKATDFPDPDVVYSGSGSTYYAYSTGTSFLVTADWTTGGIGFTKLSCTTSGCSDQSNRTVAKTKTAVPRSLNVSYGLQAPSVAYLNNQWVMYYGGYYAGANTGAYAIYYSTSSSPTSNFTNSLTEVPLIAQTGTGGSTDPSAFIAPTGLPWLTWKTSTYRGDNDKAHLWSMRLTTDGTAMKSGASSYILATQPTGGWANTTIENPQMVWSGGTYYLFYSGGLWTTDTYAEGYTTCSGPTGGCGTPNTYRILSKYTAGVYGPGGGSLFTTTTGTWLMAFHSWNSGCTRYATSCNGYRDLYVRPVDGLYPTSLPNISSFTASATTLPATGGTVTLTAHATRAVSYTFISSPGPTGIPAFANTTSGIASATVHIPANTSTSPVHYTFAVYATGPYGGQVSKGLGVAVAAKTPPPVSSSGAIFVRPDGEADVVYEGPNHELRYSWALPGQAWSTMTISGANSDYSAPSIVVRSDGEADVAYEGPSNELRYSWAFPDGSWSTMTISGANSDYSAPSIVVRSDGEADIAYQGPSNELRYSWALPGQAFGITTIGGANSDYSAPSIVVRSDGEADIAYQGPSNELRYSWALPGQAFGITTIGGANSDYSAPSIVVRSDGEADIAYQGPSNELRYSWALPGQAFGITTIGGANSDYSAPSIVVRSDGEADIAYQGPSNELRYSWALPGQAFGITTIGGANSDYSAPSIVVRSDGEADIAYQGPSNELRYSWALPGQAFGITTIGGANSDYSAPAGPAGPAVVYGSTFHVVYLGTNGYVYNDAFTPSTAKWSNQELPTSVSASGSPTAVVYGSTFHVVYLGTNGYVYNDAFTPSTAKWSNQELPTSVSASGSPTAVVYGSTFHVVYLGTNGYVYNDAFTPSTAKWSNQELPTSVSASGSPTAVVYGSTFHVVYLGTNGYVYNDAFTPSTAKWSNQELPTSVSASGSPTAVVYGSTFHVVYLGTNGYVYNDAFTPSTAKWSNQELPTSVSASGSPTAVVYGSTFHVVYLGTNGYVYNDAFTPSTAKWSNQELPTSVSASGSPTAVVYGSTFHVVYLGTNGYVYNDSVHTVDGQVVQPGAADIGVGLEILNFERHVGPRATSRSSFVDDSPSARRAFFDPSAAVSRQPSCTTDGRVPEELLDVVLIGVRRGTATGGAP